MTHATLDIDIRRATTSGKRSTALSITPIAAPPGQRPLFIRRDELFYWTREWQEGERESAEARAAGELRTFKTARDAIDWLKD